MASRRVLLIGWDGAHWPAIDPLLERGLMPSLEGVVRRGVMGSLASFDPLVCPMIWTSLVTGRRPDAHGVLGSFETDARGRARRVRSTSRKAKAVWNILSENGCRSIAVGFMASHPAERIAGVTVSDHFGRTLSAPPRPLPPGCVYPERLEAVLSELRIPPEELTGAHIAPFVPGASEISKDEDGELSAIAAIVAECASVHAAATWLMENETWDFCAIFYDAIASFSRRFLREHLAPEKGPYKDVVTGAYRFQDMMLGRLLELAGPETLVMIVSDHGFQTHLFPEGSSAHPKVVTYRGDGIFCAAGPKSLVDERIYGASIFDITPTLLSLFGLPASDEMVGQPLARAFEVLDAAPRVESWEGHARENAVPTPDMHAVVEESFDVDATASSFDVSLTLDDNLARAELASGRAAEALVILRRLSVARPESGDIKLMMAQAYYALGDREAAREILDALESDGYRAPMADVLASFLLFAEGCKDEAVDRLRTAEATDVSSPGLYSEIGNAFLQMALWNDAERAFRRALETDGDRAATRTGLAKALLELGKLDEAAQEALTAVWLQYDFPEAHFHLGVALARAERWERAREAFETCLSLDTCARGAHLWLARIHESVTGDLERALEHRRRAKELE